MQQSVRFVTVIVHNASRTHWINCAHIENSHDGCNTGDHTMKTLNVFVFGLIATLASALILFAKAPGVADLLADHSVMLVMAIGILGLVGAREKTPTPQA